MATIEELEARAAELDAAEGAALYALAECMRTVAVELPDGSKLAIDLATTAAKLADASDWPRRGRSCGDYGGLALHNMASEIYRERAPKDDA